MNARRRVAAPAAALIGLGLLLYRPRLVPPLRPGTRGAEEQDASIRRATTNEPMARSKAITRGDIAASARRRRETHEEAARRDALSGRAVFNGEHNRNAARRAEGAPPWEDAPGSRVGPPGPRSGSAALQRRVEPQWPAAGPPSPALPRRMARPAASQRRAEFPRHAARSPGSPGLFGGFFTGPAPSNDEDADDDRAVIAGTQDGEGALASPARFARLRRLFPLFRPPQRSAGKARNRDPHRRVRPPLLARLLGGGARRPPKSSLSPPDLSRLDGLRPKNLPDGGPVPARAFELEDVETVDPARAGAAPDRRRAAHWHSAVLPADVQPLGPAAQPLGPAARPLGPAARPLGTELLWHSGAARGIIDDDRWLWLWRDGERWWAAPGGGSPSGPESSPLLRHQGLWWQKRLGVWFALHEGELWSWRRFSQWNAEGLLRLADGVSIVYSADFSRVAVVAAGGGAVLYDAATGVELGRWREDELPRRHPRPPTAGSLPADLRPPRGI